MNHTKPLTFCLIRLKRLEDILIGSIIKLIRHLCEIPWPCQMTCLSSQWRSKTLQCCVQKLQEHKSCMADSKTDVFRCVFFLFRSFLLRFPWHVWSNVINSVLTEFSYLFHWRKIPGSLNVFCLVVLKRVSNVISSEAIRAFWRNWAVLFSDEKFRA